MKVKELLTDESKWTKGALARNIKGTSLDFDGPDAVCWCLVGALIKCYPDDDRRIKIFSLIIINLKPKNSHGIGPYKSYLANWNDAPERTFKDVKELVETLDI